MYNLILHQSTSVADYAPRHLLILPNVPGSFIDKDFFSTANGSYIYYLRFLMKGYLHPAPCAPSGTLKDSACSKLKHHPEELSNPTFCIYQQPQVVERVTVAGRNAHDTDRPFKTFGPGQRRPFPIAPGTSVILRKRREFGEAIGRTRKNQLGVV